MTSAILAGLAALVGLATVAWHRYRRRAAEDARDRATARADRAEADAAGLAETARAAADQLDHDEAIGILRRGLAAIASGGQPADVARVISPPATITSRRSSSNRRIR